MFYSTDNGLKWNAANKGLYLPIQEEDTDGGWFPHELGLVTTYNQYLILNSYFSNDCDKQWIKSLPWAGWGLAFDGSEMLTFSPIWNGEDGVTGSYVYKSSDSGRTFAKVTTIGDQGAIGPGYSMLVHDAYYFVGTRQMYGFAGMNNVYVSTDNGTSWQIQNKGLTDSAVSCFAFINYQNTNYVFAGTQKGVFVSSNFGAEWKQTGTGPTKITNIATKINSQGFTLLFVGTDSSGIFISSDRGITWSASNNGLNNLHISKILANDKYVFCMIRDSVINGGGIYFSIDNAASWRTLNTGLPLCNISDISVGDKILYAYFPSSGYDFSTNGLWCFPLSSIASFHENISYTSSSEFALKQNYPNPFNPTTVISYQLPVNSFITLKVFDVLGREITTLVNEKKDAGNYSVQFSINNYQLPSGVYFYRIQTGSFSEVKKMLMVK